MGVGEVQGGVIDGSNLQPKVVQGGIPIAIERRWEADY